MAITAKEIAEIAGVSRGTVDRALKGRSGIAPETKEKILSIAKKYDYKPNIIGKALVYSGKSIDVVVLLNSVGNPFFDEVKRGIFSAENAFSDYGFSVNLSEFKGYSAKELLDRLNALPPQTKQVILTPISHPMVKEKLKKMLEDGIQIVMLSAVMDDLPGAVYVGCDYLKSGRVAGRLTGLLSQGRANLFIMVGNTQHQGHFQRVAGLRSVLEKDYPQIKLVGMTENDDDDKVAYRVMKNALRKNPEIDFVYITAAGVNGTLKAIGEHTHPIRVCTFDDTEVTRKAMGEGKVLATICQQPYEQGYQALKVLYDKIILKNQVESHIYTELFIKVDQSL